MRVLELFCGIGGFHSALDKARERLSGSPESNSFSDSEPEIVASDINELSNDTYELNFGIRPLQKAIESLPLAVLESFDLWMASPPCQPYSRNGNQKGGQDARATAFMTLIKRLSELKDPPARILVENVVGFEKCSDTFLALLAALAARGYAWRAYILSPHDLHIPYSRPRFFLLAKRQPLAFADDGGPGGAPTPLPWSPTLLPPKLRRPAPTNPRTLTDYLTLDPTESDGPLPSAKKSFRRRPSVTDSVQIQIHPATESLLDGHPSSPDPWAPFLLDLGALGTAAEALDIAPPHLTTPDRPCCCITKNYARFVRGTGSVVPSAPSAAQTLADGVTVGLSAETLESLALRFLTPREIANLKGFPPEFRFPADLALSQRYQQLGNSLSVDVVSELLVFLLCEPAQE